MRKVPKSMMQSIAMTMGRLYRGSRGRWPLIAEKSIALVGTWLQIRSSSSSLHVELDIGFWNQL